jgi:ornithine--oxo-acid transaminase
VPYGDAAALKEAITPDTVGFLVEPIQGEAGVVIPPDGYLRACRDLCADAGVLFMADEIQSGLGRTGRTFACDHEEVQPDVYILGKALGGGIMPLSAVAADADVLGVMTAGTHGSTFGGNPLACAVGREVLAMLSTGAFQDRAAELGAVMAAELAKLPDTHVSEVRVRGLWAGIDFTDRVPSGRAVCEELLARGVLAKDTHGQTIRLAPPLTIDEADLTHALTQLAEAVATWP